MKEVIATIVDDNSPALHIYHVCIDGSVVDSMYSKFNSNFSVTKRSINYKQLGIILSDEQEERIKAHLKVTERLKEVTNKEV
ncbi:MAG: hypothetical protein JST04_00940 [Bdellovibrionales bacterium]|nr:hypothetical protein [Bdellovibrionales bacterium]